MLVLSVDGCFLLFLLIWRETQHVRRFRGWLTPSMNAFRSYRAYAMNYGVVRTDFLFGRPVGSPACSRSPAATSWRSSLTAFIASRTRRRSSHSGSPACRPRISSASLERPGMPHPPRWMSSATGSARRPVPSFSLVGPSANRFVRKFGLIQGLDGSSSPSSAAIPAMRNAERSFVTHHDSYPNMSRRSRRRRPSTPRYISTSCLSRRSRSACASVSYPPTSGRGSPVSGVAGQSGVRCRI